jgi:hypothetical protein
MPFRMTRFRLLAAVAVFAALVVQLNVSSAAVSAAPVVDGNGVPSVASIVQAAAPTDTSPPTVSITAPGGGIVTGTIDVTAEAADDTGVESVQFKLDGQDLGDTDPVAPYSVSWDTTTAADGAHALTAVARDFAGNTAQSQARTVTVANGLNTADAFKLVAVGPGYVHASTREVVRTSGGRVYIFAADDTAQRQGTGPGTIHAWKADRTGIPTGFSEVDASNRPIGPAGTTMVIGSPDVRLDRAGIVHLLFTSESDSTVVYRTFSTVTDKWGASEIVATGVTVPYSSSFHKRNTTNAIVLDANDVPHVAYVAGTSVVYRNRIGGTWSTPATLATVTAGKPSHTQLAMDNAGNMHLVWLVDGIPAPRVEYKRRAADGTWGATEVVVDADVSPNDSEDQGPSVVVTQAGVPYVLRIGAIDSRGSCCSDGVKVRYRSGSTWVSDDPPVNVYTHAPQIYSRGNDIYVFLGHDLGIEYGYVYHLAGQAWSNAIRLTSGYTLDGSASVRWDPQRETNPNVIDTSLYDEDLFDDKRYIPRLYYMAILPSGGPPADTTPPSTPTGLAQSGATQTSVSVQWNPSTDNASVAGYGLYLGGSSTGSTTATTATFGSLGCGTSHAVEVDAFDPAGNRSARASVTAFTSPCDTVPPTVFVTSPPGGATVTGVVNVTADASDAGGVAGVQFKLDGVNLGAEDTALPYSLNWNSATTANGQHTLTAVARDAAGNQATSGPVTVTVENSFLVAAYSFDEGGGSNAADASGNGNAGALNGAAWTTVGKNGGALSFDGVNDSVTVADSGSLDLTEGMTLEAWVRPTELSGSWRTVLLKEQPGGLAYGLYAHTSSQGPSVHISTGGSEPRARSASAIAGDAWTHLAGTYDGATLRLYVNGALAESQAAGGAISTSTGALWIGGNSVWSEWFQGLIDDVRVYNRALTGAEIQADMQTPVGGGPPPAPDTQAPTAPTGISATTSPGSATLTWAASSDNVGVVHYNLHRSQTSGFTPSAANRIAQPTSTSYTDSGLPAGIYYYRVTADDAAGNTSSSSNEATALVPDQPLPPPPPPSPPPGLVAAYAFDEGSGSSAADASGNSNTGQINGATWASTGKDGGALSFDGVNDSVTVADSAPLDLTDGMTLEAWVKPTLLGGSWRTVLLKEQAGGLAYALYAHTSSLGPSVHLSSGGNEPRARSATAIAVDTWTHLAGTYDGVTLRLYVNGTLVVSQAASGAITTSTGAIRIGGNTVWSEWFQGLIDDIRIYSRSLTPTEVQTDMQTPVADTTPPTVSLSAPVTGTTVSGTVSVKAGATDDVGVAGVQFALDGQNLGAEDTDPPYELLWETRIYANGVHALQATARDAAGNRATSTPIVVTVDNVVPPPSAGSLVAAYAFDEGAGSATADASGNGNDGTISGAAWTSVGKHGSALSFDGVNDWVTVNDSQSLHLEGGLTLSAWVKPTAGGSSWQTVVLKEATGHLDYALYASATAGLPSGHAYIDGADERTNGPSPLPSDTWSYLAATYDGSQLLLYRDGVEIASTPLEGGLAMGTGQLRIGGNGIWTEWFHGLIDDLRLYDRALTPTEIQTDMTRAVAP